MSSVLILGNGVSRLTEKSYIDNWKGELWACNFAFKEYMFLPHIDRLGSAHREVLEEAIQFRRDHGLDFRLFSYIKMTEVEPFACAKGWSTGSLMLQQAMYENFDKIVLAGFDMGGPDIYNPANSGSNFRKQFNTIMKEFGFGKVYRLLGGKENLVTTGVSEIV